MTVFTEYFQSASSVIYQAKACRLPGAYTFSQYPPREIIIVMFTCCHNAQRYELINYDPTVIQFAQSNQRE